MKNKIIYNGIATQENGGHYIAANWATVDTGSEYVTVYDNDRHFPESAALLHQDDAVEIASRRTEKFLAQCHNGQFFENEWGTRITK